MKKKRIAMVIGSGSVKCAAALGLQNVLTREGIDVDMYVGCSAGSIYAALLAIGLGPQKSAEMAMQFWTRDITGKRHTLSVLRAMFPRLFKFDETFGMRDDKLIMRRLEAGFGERRIEATPTPLFITATDFANGDQVVFSSGRLVDAVRASIAIPYIFKPWPIGGRLLIDGFMSD